MIYAHTFDSPVGKLVATVDHDNRVTRLLFAKERSAESLLSNAQEAIEWSSNRCQSVQIQLAEYFAGKRRAFDLELSPSGTAFQKTVWNVLRNIPFGQTRSYGEIAQEIDKPGASRAVGRANGTNPISMAYNRTTAERLQPMRCRVAISPARRRVDSSNTSPHSSAVVVASTPENESKKV